MDLGFVRLGRETEVLYSLGHDQCLCPLPSIYPV
jgi:hypothetical protein